MKKHLLATTAALSLMAAPIAFAQEAADNMDPAPIFGQEEYEGTGAVDGFYNADPNQVLATRFIGAYIYNSTAEDAETVGDVNDIIMTPDGRAVAVIAGVGGFLGIGEKEVAVSIDQLRWETDADGDMILVGELSKEQLEGAPEFDRSVFNPDQNMAMDATGETGDDMNATEEMAATEQPATGENMEATEDMAATEQPATGEAMEASEEEMAAAEQPADEETAMETDNTMTAATPQMETVSAAEAQLEASEIMGMSVIGADNENIGEVSEILIDEGGKVEAFIVDVGGFLGINEKPVAVSFDELQFARAEGADNWTAIKTGLTSESLEGHEAYSEDQYKSDKDSVTLVAPVQ